MDLDDKAILSLMATPDEIGVLSVYAGVAPEGTGRAKSGSTIEIANRLRDLTKLLRQNRRPREQRVAIEARLSSIGSDVETLLDPRGFGRGRALFVWIANQRVEEVRVQAPLPSDVRLGPRAFVRPLVVIYDEGRPAGIAAVHRRGVRLIEWRLWEATEAGSFRFDESEAEDWRPQRGPSGGAPPVAQKGVSHRERFEQRLEDHRLRFMRTTAAEVAAIAGGRGWDRLLVSGEPRLARAFAESIAGDRMDVVVAESIWESETLHLIAKSAEPHLDRMNRRREAELASRAIDRALGGGAGALGVRPVREALAGGRVEHLLFESGLESDDVETVVEQSLATGAKVTPVEGEAAESLRPYEGVAALLRW